MSNQAPEVNPEARIGEVVDGRYRIVAHIATGGMASVYRAEHAVNGTLVAVKILHAAFGEHTEALARFRREAVAARSIRHPNVVSVWDFGRLADGSCYMVLDYIPGEDLWVLLHGEKPLAQERAVKIAMQVARALGGAHGAGVVHRDLKPENIMLIEKDGDRDFVKVVDFGIAKVPLRSGPALTAIGSVFGTPEYMAPEQAKGEPADNRSDLYTVGILLYEMLVGRTPFADEVYAKVLLGHVSHLPPPLPSTVDPELSALVMRLLAKSRDDRVQTATELAQRLTAILARLAPGHPALASSPPSAARPAAPIYVPAAAPLPIVAAAPAQVSAPHPAHVAPRPAAVPQAPGYVAQPTAPMPPQPAVAAPQPESAVSVPSKSSSAMIAVVVALALVVVMVIVIVARFVL